MISYGKQNINDRDIAAVSEVLKSSFLTQGPKIEEFEKALCGYTGARYCVLVSNGTAALHIAVASLELPEGCEGVTSSITFAATSNSMLYCGVKPVFADIDATTYNLSPDKAAQKITPETRLISPVHFAGRVCEMEQIGSLAQTHRLRVIEDAAHAIGSQYPCGAKVGSCKYSDLTTFSFHPVKTITTGEGGAVMTNDEELYQRLLLLRSHGITKNPRLLKQNPGPWYYEMQELGFNYRLTDMQAALGLSQLSRLELFKSRRLEIVKEYNSAFRNEAGLQIPCEISQDDMCYHLYPLKIDFAAIGKSRVQIMQELKNAGIGTQVHYIPVHMQPYYQEKLGYRTGDFPEAESFYDRELSLPLYPDLTDEDVRHVIQTIKKCIKSA